MGCNVSSPRLDFGVDADGIPCPLSPSHNERNGVDPLSPRVAVAKDVHTRGKAVLRGANYGRVVVHATHLKQRLGTANVRRALTTSGEPRRSVHPVSGVCVDGWANETSHDSAFNFNCGGDGSSLSLELPVNDIIDEDEAEEHNWSGNGERSTGCTGGATPDTATSQSVRSSTTSKHTWISKSMWVPTPGLDPSPIALGPIRRGRAKSAGAVPRSPNLHPSDFNAMMRLRPTSTKRSSAGHAGDATWLAGVHSRRKESPPSPVGLVHFLTMTD